MPARGLRRTCVQIVLAGFIALLGVNAAFAATCLQSSSTWTNTAISTETSTFTAAWDATPSATDIDTVTGFSSSAATGYASLAAIARFNPSGTIDARNGGNYTASQSIPYSAGQSYHFRLVINPASHTYSAYVTPPGSAELTVANNYSFRSEQATTASISDWAIYREVGSQTVCNMAITAGSGGGSGSATAPSITAQPSSVTVAAGQTASFSVTASGTAPLTYQWKKNGSSISGATSQSYTTPATSATDSGSQFTVVVSNSAGSVTSGAATLTVTSTSSCLQSSDNWSNTSIPLETSTFTAAWDGTPSATDVDTVLGFSLNAASDYTNLAAIVRFNPSGDIDARNGANYAASQVLPYTAGQKYHFRVVINPAAHTYSVYVTPPGASELTLATNFSFRSEQAGTSSLNNWSVYAEQGFQTACNMAITAGGSTGSGSGSSGSGGGTTGTPSIGISASSLAFGNVTVGSSKTLAVTISSTGTGGLTLSSDSISGSGFSAVGNPSLSGLILSPGQTATLNVTFDPSTTGTFTGTATINSNASNSPTENISVSGTGVAQTISHSVTLTWLASPSTVIGYDVYRATVSGGPYTQLNSSVVSALTYKDTNVTAGATYYYVVTAVNSANVQSANSNQASAKIPTP